MWGVGDTSQLQLIYLDSFFIIPKPVCMGTAVSSFNSRFQGQMDYYLSRKVLIFLLNNFLDLLFLLKLNEIVI